ncbi:MAG: response regulator, partial [Pirellulales bacterium]|nr:response regulator [Pirellulales bacterium]
VPFVLVSAFYGDLPKLSPLTARRILVVDDNQTNLIILAGYLSEWGVASTVLASSVDEAIAKIDQAETKGAPFEVVLTDYNMPQRSGLDLANALKERSLKIVLLASSTDNQLSPGELPKHGIDAMLPKPVRGRQLHNVICGLFAENRNVTKPTEDETSAAQYPNLQAGHILLAEDNAINQMYMVELIKQLGCTSDVASNGVEVLDALQRAKYDLVLMDCQMPEMDGFDATRRIRQLEAEGSLDGHLPIVALTANAVKGDRQRCLDAGMDDYLSKPVQTTQIIDILKRLLGSAPRQTTEKQPEHIPSDETTEMYDLAPIDAASLLSRCLGNVEFANALLDELESSGKERVEEIRQRSEQQDPVALAKAAHALKGAAGILCAEAVRKIAAEIEQSGRSAELQDIETQLDDLAAEMERCLNHVPQLRQDLVSVEAGV